MTRGAYSAMISSLPTPFCTEQTAPSSKTGATAAIAGRVCRVFVATMPNSQGGISPASQRASMRVTKSLAPVRRRPFLSMASTCSRQGS